MGKILIIRGTYTPPSGSGSDTPVIPDTPGINNPPQHSTLYQVFFTTDNETWTLTKPSSGIRSVALVVPDRNEVDLDAISYTHSDDIGTAYFCRKDDVIQVVDGVFYANASAWNDMESIPVGRYDFPTVTRAVFVWLFAGSEISSAELETRLTAAKESIAWITG